ncbi:MAG: hypothetical protein K0R46_858, partial [Herbinix sp.]|nr:hypothetical protein [Herbinix sp.]
TTKTFVVEDPTVASGSVLTMVQNAFSLYLNGDKVSDANEANIVEITFNDGAGVDKVWNTSTPQTVLAGTNLSVKSVKYHVINNGTDGLANTADDTRTEYKFDLNVTIKAE